MKPKISVLTTVYNGERYLEETIKSVLNQTFKNFEYIIVDDGSTDKTKEIIKKFEKKDSRIKYFYYGKNKGYFNLHNVINKGLDVAKGKYVARLDADDICHKDRLRIQHNYLERHKDIFIVGSSAEVIDKNGNKIGFMKKKPWPSWFLKLIIGFNNPFIHSSIMFRNENLRYPYHNEHFFYFNALVNEKKLKNMVFPLIKYRINPEGVMSKYAKLEKGKYGSLWRRKD